MSRGHIGVAATTASNAGGLTVLERLGFDLTPADEGRGTCALLDLEPQL